MELVHEMTYHAMLKPPMPVGDGPSGTRMVYDVIEGRIEGPRISGNFKGAGADWLLIGPDGYGRLDVRAQIETDDGAFIYVQYFGLIHLNDNVQAAMADGEDTEGTDFGDQYFYISPRFETGDERYAWLNQSVFVGEGRIYPGFGVEYKVQRVV